MGEYGAMFAVSGIAVLLFLGGWNLGLLPFDPAVQLSIWLGSAEQPSALGFFLGNVFNVIVFIVKAWLLVFVQMWVRWTLPRLRIDQVMMTCLKYFLPISCVLLMGVSLWQVLLLPLVGAFFKYVLGGLTVAGFAWMIYKIVTTPHNLPTPGVPPNLWAASTPRA